MDLHLIGRKLWWLLVVSLVRESTCLKGPWVSIPPFVKSGDTVTFSCEYDTENVDLYVLKWYRDVHEFFRYTPKMEPPFMYFRMQNLDVDVSQSGLNKVTLRNVTKEQTGRYECEVTTDAPWFQTEMKSSIMTVIDVPSSDPSLNVSHESATVGTKLSAECSVSGFTTPVNITWSINDKQLQVSNDNNQSVVISTYEYANEERLGRVSRKIEITTDSSHFIQGVLSLKCEANIYNIWNRTMEKQVKELDPSKIMAELTVSSTSSQQSQNNDLDTGRNI